MNFAHHAAGRSKTDLDRCIIRSDWDYVRLYHAAEESGDTCLRYINLVSESRSENYFTLTCWLMLSYHRNTDYVLIPKAKAAFAVHTLQEDGWTFEVDQARL